MTEKDIAKLSFEFFEHVEKKDGFPVSIGSWVVAPKKMNKDNSSLLSIYLLTGLRSWEVNLKANTFLLLRHWMSGKVWINTPYLNVRRGQVALRSAMGEKPSALIASGWNRSINKIDILDNFANFLPDGNYTITQIYYDKKSNSESFTFSSDEANDDLTFPKISNAGINGVSIRIKFKKLDSSVSIWNLNVIALKLDGDPIIVPFQIDLAKEKENLALPLPVENDKWEKGVYQIYIDAGKEIQGPFEFRH